MDNFLYEDYCILGSDIVQSGREMLYVQSSNLNMEG
jgi:hypothetical protein